jgi:hypothetical protein
VIGFDASAALLLARDMDMSPRLVATQGRRLVAEGLEKIEETWKAEAEVTAGAHGKHYPKRIGSRMLAGFTTIQGEVGPIKPGPQADMSFEFGSVNQPPHLDGQRAAEAHEQGILRSFDRLRIL